MSYLVTTAEGKTLRRNRRQLLKNNYTKSSINDDKNDDYTSSIREDKEKTKTQMNAVPPQHTYTETSAQTTVTSAQNAMSRKDHTPLRRSSRVTARPDRYSDTWYK